MKDTHKMDKQDRNQILHACQVMSEPSLAIKLANAIGKPVESITDLLPDWLQKRIQIRTRDIMMACLATGTYRMDLEKRPAKTWRLRAINTTSGFATGLAGPLGLIIDVPFSTSIIFRSMAQIAREHGENPSLPETRVACLEVFAMGGCNSNDDAAEAGYYAVRLALAKASREAGQYLARNSVIREGAPAILNCISQVSTRFGIQLSQKALASAVPIAAAFSAGTINNIFTGHFQRMAKAHFLIRSMERKYGQNPVRALIENGPAI